MHDEIWWADESRCSPSGCLSAQVWRRARWHGLKICSRPTCCCIWTVSVRQVGLHASPEAQCCAFYWHRLICCPQGPPLSARTSADRCCATVAGSLCMSWRPELMWVDSQISPTQTVDSIQLWSTHPHDDGNVVLDHLQLIWRRLWKPQDPKLIKKLHPFCAKKKKIIVGVCFQLYIYS